MMAFGRARTVSEVVRKDARPAVFNRRLLRELNSRMIPVSVFLRHLKN